MDTRVSVEEIGASPRVGDIWQEVDPRIQRFVRVSKVSKDYAWVYAVDENAAGEWVCSVNPKTNRPAPERCAQLKRFNGKRTGYALHFRPEAA